MITGKTKVVGLIGHPVEHSLSPAMHNAAFKYLDLDFVYVPFDVSRKQLESAITGAKSLNIKGLNVTIPHKSEVINYLDSLDEISELIGAVNTIKFSIQGVEGYNTDGVGAVRAIEEISSIKNKKIIILGAGGASRAISFQIIVKGADKVIIANRTLDKAFHLKSNLINKLNADVESVGLTDELKKELEDADILINTTPVGMYPNVNEKPLVTSDMMHEGLIVNDIIYNPLKTGILKEAEIAGATPVSGIKMLIYQGIESFKIWTGVEPPVEVFQQSLESLL